MSHTPSPAAPKKPCLARFATWLALCFLATLGAVAAPAEAAGLVVRDVQVALDDGVYELDATLDLPLPDDARKAIDAGLTMRLNYEIVVSRVRRYMLDAEVATLEQRYELSYHALSQRYLVRNLNAGEQQDFGSLAAAIERVSELRGLPILDSALATPGPDYVGRIRAVLDLSTAPDAFGWLLFWTDDWNAVSDWKTWKLRP
jgi:hypothetical protein